MAKRYASAEIAIHSEMPPVKFPVPLHTISGGRVVGHVDLYEVMAFKFASGRDCARARTSPLDRGSLISLIQLFLSSRFSFFPPSYSLKRGSERVSATPFLYADLRFLFVSTPLPSLPCTLCWPAS